VTGVQTCALPICLPQEISDNHLLKWAQQIPNMLMQDASWQNQIILQWLSQSPTSWEIDSEIGSLDGDLLVVDTESPGLISYLRYNTWLDAEHLNPLMDKNYSAKQIEDLVEMSNADSRFELYEIGHKAAEQELQASHFPERFTL